LMGNRVRLSGLSGGMVPGRAISLLHESIIY
jgi:hypothetical protein